MNDNKPHHLWEVYPVAALHDSDYVVPSWEAFLDFWNETPSGDVLPHLSEAFENDRNPIHLMTLVRWWWIDDEMDVSGLYQDSEFSDWPWFDQSEEQKHIPDGSLFLTFYNSHNGALDKFMIRVSKDDEESVKAWLKEQIDFIVETLWYPIQVHGKKVTRVSDDPSNRDVAVELWSDQ